MSTRGDSGMADIKEWRDNLNLNELSFLNTKYTFYSNANANWLDRVFYQKGWDKYFGKIHMEALPTSRSDHRPLLIECDSKYEDSKNDDDDETSTM